MRTGLFILILLTNTMRLCGQDKTLFPYLTKVSIDKTFNVIFGYDKKSSRLINKPCYLLSKNDPLHCDKDIVLAEWVLVAKFKIENVNDSVNIIYSPGMSDDPGFVISTKSDKIIGRFSCIEFYINNSGTVYTSGHVNNMYDRRRKFQVQTDSITEIKQPYNFVGLKGKALRDVTLYNDKIGDGIVAQIPKGYQVEILLAESTTRDFEMDLNFLVKTEFGLVGWLRLEGFSDRVIEGLYFAGD
ncbi:MAG: hypothetical protein JNM78_20370 [Cyclobacteriaceae bacterium]|nr:hypothetical protein [Cyclobacteriaceae bacterium]